MMIWSVDDEHFIDRIGYVKDHMYSYDGKVWFYETEPYREIPQKDFFDEILLFRDKHVYVKKYGKKKVVLVSESIEKFPDPEEVVKIFQAIGDPNEYCTASELIIYPYEIVCR